MSGVDNTVQLLCEIEASASRVALNTTRPPLHLAVVIDRSWSMEGEDYFKETSRSSRVEVVGSENKEP